AFLEEFLKRSTEPADTQDDNWIGDDDMDAAVEKFRVLSPSDKKACLDNARQMIANTVDQTATALKGPEKTWPKISDKPTTSLPESIAAFCTDGDVAACQADLRNRVQMRLLLVHGLIEKFRLEMDHLPAKLEDLNDPKLVVDPLNGKLFIY